MSKVDSKLVTIAQMPGCLECRWTLDCQWCGAEVWEEAETEPNHPTITQRIAAAEKVVGKQSHWALHNMVKALSFAPHILNTPEDNERLQAAKFLLSQSSGPTVRSLTDKLNSKL